MLDVLTWTPPHYDVENQIVLEDTRLGRKVKVDTSHTRTVK